MPRKNITRAALRARAWRQAQGPEFKAAEASRKREARATKTAARKLHQQAQREEAAEYGLGHGDLSDLIDEPVAWLEAA